MTEAEMRAICLSFPGVAEGTSYGRPSFLVNKKFFTRLRAEDDSMVLLEVRSTSARCSSRPSHKPSTSPLTTRIIRASWPGSPPCIPDRSGIFSNVAG